MADDDAEQVETPKAATEGGMVGKLIAGALSFVIVFVAVIAAGMVDRMMHPVQELIVDKDGQLTLKPPEPEKAAAAEEAAIKPGTPAVYFALEPPVVVNFDDQGTVRFLQVTIEVMTRDPASITAVQQHAPLIRNDLMLLLSNRTLADLMSREGKEALRMEALAEVQRILKRETGKTGIESLLFTSFVVQ